MDVHQKYELLEPLPGEGPKSFRARHSGRDVTVHVLVGGQTPENQGLLARLRALPPNSLARLIEVGNNSDGTQYVVTIAPPFQHLVDWLKDQEAAATDTQRFSRAGAWKVPTTPPAAAPTPLPPVEPAAPSAFADMFRASEPAPTGQTMAPDASAAPPPVASEPGEFTRLFQTGAVPAAPPAAPSPVPPAIAKIPQPSLTPVKPTPQAPAAAPAAPPAPPPPAAAPAPPPVASAPGEFTRLFQTAAVPAAPPAAPSPVPPAIAKIPQPSTGPAAPIPQGPAAPPAGSSPGEFTRLFREPAAPMAEPTPPPPPPASSSPGDFTRMFQQSSMPSAPAPGDWPAPPPPPAEAGEFTRLFQSPSPAAPPPESRSQGSEFTRFFQAPPPGTEGPPLPAASGFPSAAGAPSAPPPRHAAPAGATQAFAIPSVPQQGQMPDAPQGPSEYTRMMAAAPVPGAGGAAAPPALGFPQMPQMPQANLPAMPQANVPQMPGMAQPAIPRPAVPQFSVPQPPAPVKAPSTNLLLFAILGLLMFLVGGLIVFLLMRH